jgi:hypothetical protein
MVQGTERTALFHRRLSHLNYKSLRLLSHLSAGMVLDGTPHTCCIQAKSHKESFPRSKSHAARIGELIHTDICYIGVETILRDYTMFITFIDDATRYQQYTCFVAKEMRLMPSSIMKLKSSISLSDTYLRYALMVALYTSETL